MACSGGAQGHAPWLRSSELAMELLPCTVYGFLVLRNGYGASSLHSFWPFLFFKMAMELLPLHSFWPFLLLRNDYAASQIMAFLFLRNGYGASLLKTLMTRPLPICAKISVNCGSTMAISFQQQQQSTQKDCAFFVIENRLSSFSLPRIKL